MNSNIDRKNISEGFILLADDDSDDRMLMDDFFSKNGYKARLLNSGLAVLEYLSAVSPEFYPSVVLLDYSMPVFTGEDVLVFIKTTDKLKHLPVMIYSSEMNEHLKARLIALGAAACFSKAAQQSEWNKMKRTFEALLVSPSHLSANM